MFTHAQRVGDLPALVGVDGGGVRGQVSVSIEYHVDLGQPESVVLQIRLKAIHGIDGVLQRFLALRQSVIHLHKYTHTNTTRSDQRSQTSSENRAIQNL